MFRKEENSRFIIVKCSIAFPFLFCTKMESLLLSLAHVCMLDSYALGSGHLLLGGVGVGELWRGG